jgi:hypothetical protein
MPVCLPIAPAPTQVMCCHQEFLLRAADGALLTQLPILKCVLELQRCAHDLWREGAVLSVRSAEPGACGVYRCAASKSGGSASGGGSERPALANPLVGRTTGCVARCQDVSAHELLRPNLRPRSPHARAPQVGAHREQL